MSALQADKKLPTIWHRSRGLYSGQCALCSQPRSPALCSGDWRGGFAESPPSPNCPFLFLAGTRGADSSRSATVMLEACGSSRFWGCMGELTGYRRAGKSSHVSWCASEGRGSWGHAAGCFSHVSLGQREGLCRWWARPGAARGFSVGIVEKLQMPAAEWAEGENPFEESFFLSLSVSLHWLYFVQFWTRRREMEQYIESRDLSSAWGGATLTDSALLCICITIIDMFSEADSEGQWGLFRACWDCISWYKNNPITAPLTPKADGPLVTSHRHWFLTT